MIFAVFNILLKRISFMSISNRSVQLRFIRISCFSSSVTIIFLPGFMVLRDTKINEFC